MLLDIFSNFFIVFGVVALLVVVTLWLTLRFSWLDLFSWLDW